MSVDFSANQYEQAFHPKKLQNWEVPKGFGRHPKTQVGSTRIISNEKGHLLQGVPRSRSCAWGSYVGTWDMPAKIPGNSITNPTARTEESIQRMNHLKASGDMVLRGQLKLSKVPDPLPVKADIDAEPQIPGNRTPEISRSGAENPVPATTSPKAGTPNSVNWPLPKSRMSEKAPSPKPTTPVLAPGACVTEDLNQSARSPYIYSSRLAQEPDTNGTVEWALPKSVEPPQM